MSSRKNKVLGIVVEIFSVAAYVLSFLFLTLVMF